MKILFITDNFPPEVNAPATRTFDHCQEWVKKGMEVTVVTCAPNFPVGKVFKGYTNKWYQVEYMKGIKVIRVWSFIAANKGSFIRILDFISFAITSFIASLFIKTDIIIATSPQFFTAVSGCFAAFCKRKPWIMEVRDMWPESIVAVGAMKPGFLLSCLEWVELFLYRNANTLVVLTDAFKKKIIQKGIAARKIKVVKNGVNLKHFRPNGQKKNLLKSLHLEGKFVVGYIGTHGMAHQLAFILDCASSANKDVHFLFLGEGAEKEKLLKKHRREQIDNATFLSAVSKEEIPNYIDIIDVALVNLKKCDTFKSVIPSKIFENAAMLKPILLGVDGESRGIIESYQAGLFFEPEHKKDFLEKLHQLKNNRKLYAALQLGCQRLSKDFDRRILADTMLQIIITTVSPNTKLPDKKALPVGYQEVSVP